MTTGLNALKAGAAIVALDKTVVRDCGIRPGDSGHVMHVSQGYVSFYIGRSRPYGWIEAKCELSQFMNCFEPDPWRSPNRAYTRSRHADRRFPDDFRDSM